MIAFACINSVYAAHCAETNTDITLGITHVFATVMYLVSTGTFTPINNAVGIGGYFIFTAFICLCGALYMLFLGRESRGLNDKERKRLYRSEKYKYYDD